MGWWSKIFGPGAEPPPINVIGGRTYPMPDDPRWEGDGYFATIDQLRVSRTRDWDGDCWREIRCDNVVMASTSSCSRYVDAVCDAQVRRKVRIANEILNQIVKGVS